MTACPDLRPLIGAYVLGALDADEAAAVRDHLAACPACAAEHSRLAPLPGLLTLAAGAEAVTDDPPPAALEERLLDAVALEPPTRRRRRRPHLAFPRRARVFAAAGLAAAVLATAAIVFAGGGGDGEGGYEVALRPTAAAARASAWARLHQVEGGTSMHLWVRGLPADRRAVYEVRCDAHGWSASAGTFRVDGEGKAYVELTTAARRGEYDAIRVVRRSDDRVVFAAALN